MTSTIPCRFYSRGTCRYGDSCRFSHGQQQVVQPQSSYGQSFGGGRVDPSLQEQINASRQNLEKNKQFFVDSMFKDIIEWEKGNIWPFSSYGPVAGKASLPHFEDLSVEEVRWLTLQNGGVPPPEFAQKLVQLNKTRMFILQNHVTARSLIDLVMDASKTSLFSTQPPTQSLPTSNFFTSQQQQPVIAPTLTGLIQSQSPPPSIFGGSSPSVSPSQVFGGQTTGFFGTTQIQPSGPVPMVAPASAFSFSLGAQSQSQPGPIAGAEGTGMDSSEMSTGITPTATSIQSFSFNQAMVQNVPPKPFSFSLGQQPPGPGPAPFVAIPPSVPGFTNFNTAPQTGQSLPFGSSMAQPNATPGTGFFQSTSSFGGGMQMQPQSGAVGVGAMSNFAYSQLSDLTAEEINEYEAQNFSSCDSIPLKPPTREMCMRY